MLLYFIATPFCFKRQRVVYEPRASGGRSSGSTVLFAGDQPWKRPRKYSIEIKGSTEEANSTNMAVNDSAMASSPGESWIVVLERGLAANTSSPVPFPLTL